jgi:hypothetical protein
MQYVDNINVLYVALTRASHAMTLIAPKPAGVEVTEDGCLADDMKFSGFSQWTMAYLASGRNELGFELDETEGMLTFRKGVMPEPPQKEDDPVASMHMEFRSWPLNDERGRLKFSADALDFFSDEGVAGASASRRIRGVVLHEILSRVVVPEDLQQSVRQAVLAGDLTEDEAVEAAAMLASRIAEVADRGWFPAERNSVLNETELIDTDGSVYRPDRVVFDSGRVTVIDYKFGEHSPRYIRQVKKYADIWKRMGYDDVSAVLWYVDSGVVMTA